MTDGVILHGQVAVEVRSWMERCGLPGILASRYNLSSVQPSLSSSKSGI